jgi:hypothetical protein
MVTMGETTAAWPLLEESLRTFRQLGLPRGEAQVLGYLAEKPHGEGDLARAIELALESAAIAHEIDWGWWESWQLAAAAEFERERGDLDAAEGHALRCLELSLSLGDRRRAVLTAAKLALIAAERGDAEQAGRLWGAIESEQTSRPVRQWENDREELEALVLGVDGPAFTRARTEGWLLSICRGGRPRRALAGSDPSRKAQDGRVDAVAIDKGHLGDRFWGQVPGFSGRFKAGWGRDRRAAERLNLRARALYENESAARFRDPEISMVSRSSNSTPISPTNRHPSREHRGEHHMTTGDPHDTNGPHG